MPPESVFPRAILGPRTILQSGGWCTRPFPVAFASYGLGALQWRREQSAAPLHFVPTMGSLHQGHQSLIRRAPAALCRHERPDPGQCVCQPSAIRPQGGFPSISARSQPRRHARRQLRGPCPVRPQGHRPFCRGRRPGSPGFNPPRRWSVNSVACPDPGTSKGWPRSSVVCWL